RGEYFTLYELQRDERRGDQDIGSSEELPMPGQGHPTHEIPREAGGGEVDDAGGEDQRDRLQADSERCLGSADRKDAADSRVGAGAEAVGLREFGEEGGQRAAVRHAFRDGYRFEEDGGREEAHSKE